MRDQRTTAKARKLAMRWEAALPAGRSPTRDQWAEAYRCADPDGWAGYGEDEAPDYADDEFASAVAPFDVGTIGIDFPNSTHGDGGSATVYLLPAGTTVVVASATWELHAFPVRIYRGGQVNEMVELAKSIIWPEAYDGEIRNLDANPEYDADIDVYVSGEAALRREWSASRAKNP